MPRCSRHGKPIIIYSGYTFEQIIDDRIVPHGAQLLQYADILADGHFEPRERNLALSFRGNMNQRIIDVKRSPTEGYVTKIRFYKDEVQVRLTFELVFFVCQSDDRYD